MSQRPAFPTAFVSLAKILLAFFLFLTTLSTRDIAREKAALAAVQQTFGHTSRSVGFDANGPASSTAQPALTALADLKPLLLTNGLPFIEDPTSLTITLLRRDLFAEGSVEIQSRFAPLLRQLAGAVRSHNLELRIAAHAPLSDVPSDDPVGSWRETVQDASALYRAFLASGLDAGSLSAFGAGASDPVVPNDTAEHRATNRRIVLTVRAHTL